MACTVGRKLVLLNARYSSTLARNYCILSRKSLPHSSQVYHQNRCVLLIKSKCFQRLMSVVNFTSEESLKSENEAQKNSSNAAAISKDKNMVLTTVEQAKLLKKKPQQPLNPRILKIAIIGAPNAGKSTLANELLGWRYSAVSNKVHTTRHKSIGVLTQGNTQLVFLDTPGMVPPRTRKKHKFERSLVVDPHSTLFEADLIMVMVDVSELWHRRELPLEIRKALEIHRNKHIILVLNKVDLYGEESNLLHTAKKLTGGYVDGSTDWFKSIHKKKKDLHDLFDVVDNLKKENEVTKSNPTKQLVQNYREHLVSSKDSVVTDSCDKSEQFECFEQSYKEFNSETENSLKMRPDLNESKEWEIYYNKMLKTISRLVQDKPGFDGFARVFHISALSQSGVHGLKEYLIESALPGEWIYNESIITDIDPIELAKMAVWEKMLDHLPKEIPYQIEIKLALWEVDDAGLLRSQFHLKCAKKRYYKYLLMDGGAVVKKIAAEAKQELMNTFRREMSLYLVAKAPPEKK